MWWTLADGLSYGPGYDVSDDDFSLDGHRPKPPPDPGDAVEDDDTATALVQDARVYAFLNSTPEELEGIALEQEATVLYHEGSDLVAEDLKQQLALIPELVDWDARADLDTADIGEEGETTDEEVQQLRDILQVHQNIFLGHGNALPPPAKGVVCDFDVGDNKPITQRSRRVPPHLLPKVYELLKRLWEAGLIEFSDSEYPPPIVIVLKKNGIDIRLCIDYRRVNELIKLLNYPLPLIDDLLDNFDAYMWFVSMGMASGFWTILMTPRSKAISAFVCPLGHFQWVRMPFGLKNVPLIYKMMLEVSVGFRTTAPRFGRRS